jgi:hypothetical protein
MDELLRTESAFSRMQQVAVNISNFQLIKVVHLVSLYMGAVF